MRGGNEHGQTYRHVTGQFVMDRADDRSAITTSFKPAFPFTMVALARGLSFLASLSIVKFADAFAAARHSRSLSGLHCQQVTCFGASSTLDDHINTPHSADRRESIMHILATAVSPLTFILPGIANASTSSPASTSKNEGGKTTASPDPELSAAAQRLFDLDMANRLVSGRDYAIDAQGSKKPSKNEDAASLALFRYLDQSVFDRPTYRTFVALLNNYNADVCSAENVSDEEKAEEYAFLHAAMATPVMQFCYQYCRSRIPEKIPETQEDFVKLLYKLWFKLYRRCDLEDETVAGSSGFEHVFVGEIRDGKVVGFHNWIQIYLQERLGNVDYRGSIGSANVAPLNENTRVLTYQLRWNGYEKYVGTSFIGVSPEYELALYTMMFLVGKQDNIILLDTGLERVKLDVKCYRIAKGKIGTCFVESVT